MEHHAHSRTVRTLADRHIDDLMEVLEELLAVPELKCFEPDEMFDSTRETMAKARVIRSAILDELALVWMNCRRSPDLLQLAAHTSHVTAKPANFKMSLK